MSRGGDVTLITSFSGRSRERVRSGATGRSNLAAAGMMIASPGRGGTGGRQEEWFATKSQAIAAQKRRQRVAGGLTAVGLPVNERDYLDVSLGYRDKMSRTDVLADRKDSMHELLESSRQRVEGSFVGQVARLEARENQDHLLRERAKVETPSSLAKASLGYIKHIEREGNKNDLLNKWQTKVDSKLPLDPNTYVSPEDRPSFWNFKPGFNPQPAFSSRSELLDARKRAYTEGLKQSYPNADVTPPTQTAMWKTKDHSANWDIPERVNFDNFRY